MSAGMMYFLMEGITHMAQAFESHDLIGLACESWFRVGKRIRFRKPSEGRVVEGPVDCMWCLVRMGAP